MFWLCLFNFVYKANRALQQGLKHLLKCDCKSRKDGAVLDERANVWRTIFITSCFTWWTHFFQTSGLLIRGHTSNWCWNGYLWCFHLSSSAIEMFFCWKFKKITVIMDYLLKHRVYIFVASLVRYEQISLKIMNVEGSHPCSFSAFTENPPWLIDGYNHLFRTYFFGRGL